jgi:hypothetical protein
MHLLALSLQARRLELELIKPHPAAAAAGMLRPAGRSISGWGGAPSRLFLISTPAGAAPQGPAERSILGVGRHSVIRSPGPPSLRPPSVIPRPQAPFFTGLSCWRRAHRSILGVAEHSVPPFSCSLVYHSAPAGAAPACHAEVHRPKHPGGCGALRSPVLCLLACRSAPSGAAP